MTGSWGEYAPRLCFRIVPIVFCSIGPTGLTRGSLIGDNETFVPTVTDNLYEQNKIFHNLVAVSFVPLALSSGSFRTGELTFGDTDPTKFVGNIEYV
jgi:hypothetical protein